MRPKRFMQIVLCLSLMSWATLGSALAARSARTVMLVPESERLIRLCGDVHRMFPDQSALVVYARRGPLALRVFNVWHTPSDQWHALTPDQWRRGEGLPAGPLRLLLVAPDAAIEPDIRRSVEWTRDLRHIPDADLSVVANRLDGFFGFSTDQWRSLAARNNLVLKDRQSEQRRYGRFGPPGQRRERITPPPTTGAATLPEPFRITPEPLPPEPAPPPRVAAPPPAPPAVAPPPVSTPPPEPRKGTRPIAPAPEPSQTQAPTPPPGLDAALQPLPVEPRRTAPDGRK